MKNEKSQKFSSYFTYEIFVAPAFRELKPAAKDILIQIYFEVEMTSKTKRNKKYQPVVINRNDIRLTYREISERLGYSDKTIWESFRQLLSNGFLKIVKHGGGAKGDFQVYGITEDWRYWQKGKVIRTIQKNGKTGWQKKISSTVGKPPRSTVGKPLHGKKETGLPVGKAL